MADPMKKGQQLHEDTVALIDGIKSLEENLASCISEEDAEKIFEPICSELNLSSSKIYKFFNEKWKNANLVKDMNTEELDDLFKQKAKLTEDCRPYDNTKAWRPSGDVKKDMSIKYNSDKIKYKEQLEKEVHTSKLEFNKLMEEISFKTNKIDNMKSVIPELDDYVCKLSLKTESTTKKLMEPLDVDKEQEIAVDYFLI